MPTAPYRASALDSSDRVVVYRPRGLFMFLLGLAALTLAGWTFVHEPPGVLVQCRPSVLDTALFSSSDHPTMFSCDEIPQFEMYGLIPQRVTMVPVWECRCGSCGPRPEPPLLVSEIERASTLRQTSFAATTSWRPFLGAVAAALTVLFCALRPFAWTLTFSPRRRAFDAIHLGEHFRAELGAVGEIQVQRRRFRRDAIVVTTKNPARSQVLHVGWLTRRDLRFVAEARAALESSRELAG